MNRKSLSLSLILLPVLFLLTVAESRGQGSNSTDLLFNVSMPKPWTHLLEVEMRVQVPPNLNVPNETNLIMPVWTPGSYLIREFERNVQDFAASDRDGHALAWEKTNKNTWRIKTNGARAWQVFYRVYANEFSVRTNELNSDHASWNNAALLMYPEGRLKSPSTLRVNAPTGWKVATGLPAVTGQPNTFAAENFDILYDSPVEVGNFKQIDFAVGGVAHRIVIDGDGNYDPSRMKKDVQKIVEAETGMFGVIPYHDYTFILHLRNGGGGLEHLNSTSLGFPGNRFGNERSWQGFYSLVAHEFFHLWNVKRIRPDALGPFDYTKENYTRSLWVAEGITDYYGGLMTRRAGLISEKDYLDGLARLIQNFQNTPGRLEMSAEEASFNAWIKEYRPDENSVNSQISYYDKGKLLGLLLDLEIRRRSNDAKSLDDVMRYLYHEFYEKNRNYTPADFQKACELMAGSSLDEFFTRYVRGRDELPYNQFFSAAGLQLEQGATPIGVVTDRVVKLKGYLGADLEDSGEFINVSDVRAGTPAYEQGLNARDRIVALNGTHVNRETFEALIAAKRAGDVVRITLLRNNDLRTLEIKLGATADVPYQIVQLPSATDEQKRRGEAWLSGQTAR
jgi:predicted metalloprotease with PDZ domain